MPQPAYIAGLPGDLPPHEHVLWQGAPAWRPLARRLCHVRTIALYFTLVTLAASSSWRPAGRGRSPSRLPCCRSLPAACSSPASSPPWPGWIARSTEYTITTHRLVMRFGLALPATLAIPHRAIARAAVRLHPDGTGNLPIETKPGFTVALHRVWPHARPWRLMRAHPMLLCVPNAGRPPPCWHKPLASAEADRLRPGAARGEAGPCASAGAGRGRIRPRQRHQIDMSGCETAHIPAWRVNNHRPRRSKGSGPWSLQPPSTTSSRPFA